MTRAPMIGTPVQYEIVGEHLPYDGRHLDCPHSPDWLREVQPPQTLITETATFDISHIECTACRYQQSLRRTRP